MRHLLLLILFMPYTGNAAVWATAMPQESVLTDHLPEAAKSTEKPGFLKPAKKLLQNRLKNTIRRAHSSDGKSLAIAGLLTGLLGVLAWFISPLAGLIISVPVGLVGLALCIIGLIKAHNWHGTRAIKILAAIGMIINIALIAGTIIIYTMLAGA